VTTPQWSANDPGNVNEVGPLIGRGPLIVDEHPAGFVYKAAKALFDA